MLELVVVVVVVAVLQLSEEDECSSGSRGLSAMEAWERFTDVILFQCHAIVFWTGCYVDSWVIIIVRIVDIQ